MKSTTEDSRSQLTIYFPAWNRSYDYFGDLDNNPTLRAAVLQRQYEAQYEDQPGERYARCACGTDSRARFVVRATALENERTRYCIARFPRSGPAHHPSCFAFSQKLPQDLTDTAKNSSLRPGDLASLIKDFGDPEAPRRPVVGRAKTQASRTERHLPATDAIRLRSLGSKLLETSGICTWHPWYTGKRGFREVNGLIWEALRRLQHNPEDPLGQQLATMADFADLVPWSATGGRTEPARKKALGFGFVTHISPPTAKGGRVFTLACPGQPGVLVPATVFEEAASNRSVPSENALLTHPVWVLFVSVCYDGQWKAHKLVGFRMTQRGLLPVESCWEESMVEHLILHGRSFKRLLTPPEPESPFIPDFQLLDTSQAHFVEVAGITDPEYEKRLAAKEARWNGRITIWRTKEPLAGLRLPDRLKPSSSESASDHTFRALDRGDSGK